MRSECVYVAKGEAAMLAGVSIGRVERWIADGKLCAWLVQLPGRDGRPGYVYRLDEVLAARESKRR